MSTTREQNQLLRQRSMRHVESDAGRELRKEEEKQAGLEIVTDRILSVNKMTWNSIRRDQFGDQSTNSMNSTTTDEDMPLGSLDDVAKPQQTIRNRSIIGLPIINPSHWFAFYWGLLTIFLDATYTSFILPIFIAFVNNEDERAWEDFIDLGAGFVFTVDFFLNLHMAYVIKYHGQYTEVRDGKRIAYYYLTRGSFFVDIVMVITFLLQLIVIGLDESTEAVVLKWILLFFRLLRLIRVIRLIKIAFLSSMTSTDSPLMLYLGATILHMMSLVFTTAVIVNFLGCVWFFVAERTIEWGSGWSNSWIVDELGLDPETTTKDEVQDLVSDKKPHFYLASIYFALTTVTTVGYGDITPSNDPERVTAMIIFMCGVIFFSFQISSVTELLANATHNQRQAQMIREKMVVVKRWMKRRHLNSKLRHKIYRFYSDVWIQQQDYLEDEFLSEIPQALRTEVAYASTQTLLRSIDLFNYIDEPSLKLISSRFQPLFVPEGDDVYREGDDADALYILDEGEITFTNKLKKLGKYKAPEILGEGSLLKDKNDHLRQRIATMTCIKESRLWRLDLEELDRLIKITPDLKENLDRGILEYVKNKIRAFTPEIATLVKDKLAALEAGTETIDENPLYDGALIAMISTLGLQDFVAKTTNKLFKNQNNRSS
eukprot:TRINITY_DN11800_c0_g1_i1.p1 TRINITY_DN11800_c0_g1~~TRINITY_DN11800_c0_g1_i1.p1  ORF type:complete len:657 (-),score=55.60 TRINITY_DN11800_c0_g1_i1:655-2625(-)